MSRLVIRLVINAAALWVATRVVGGIHVVALIFGLVNAFIRPVLAVLTCPLRIVTLGLFTLVLNALMLWLTSAVAGRLGVEFRVDGFLPAFWGALVVSMVSIILSILIGEESGKGRRR